MCFPYLIVRRSINTLVLDVKFLRGLPLENENVPYGLFRLTDSDSDSDCKPYCYTILRRNFHTVWSWIHIPILTANYRNGIRNGIRICECK